MAKFTDFYSDPEVKDLMEKWVEHRPQQFTTFDVSKLNVVYTKKKKCRRPIKLKPVGYPFSVFIGAAYVVEVFESKWRELTPAQKKLAVLHIMCCIPEGGFDEQSSHYAKVVRPEFQMHMMEFVAAGGVPNWLDNPNVKDPFELDVTLPAPAEPVEAAPAQ
jgi:hypothetical protein